MNEDDYQIVNSQGHVIRDTAVERQQEELERFRREGEPFTASVDCPWCGHLAVHWIDQPRYELRDGGPAQQAMRMINESIDNMAALWCSTPKRRYDPPGTVIARVCVKCGYRWGQT